MTYVESSVILRLALGEPGALAEWPTVHKAITSAITRVECLRTLENFRTGVEVSDLEFAERRSATLRLFETFEVIALEPIILARAASPMPTRLRTLDAVHLATALVWQDVNGEQVVLATHDRTLGTAARASGLEVIGLP